MIRPSDWITREPERVRDLPEFTDPPLSEVALSIQFAALGNLKSAHIGLLWERLRSDYPNVTEQPPIQTVFETFGIASKQGPLMQIETFLSPPLPRYWFEHPDLPDLLQVQQDRIVHNWRQHSDNSRIYPRYETVKERFEKELELFERWLSDERIGELRPNQCEVTYINIIDVPEENALHSCMENLAPVWSGEFSEDPPNELEKSHIQMTFLFSLEGKPAGRVYVTFQPAFRQSDRSPVIRLEITARGRPKGEAVKDALAFLDIEREQVVRTFAAVTTTEMHTVWGRTDGKYAQRAESFFYESTATTAAESRRVSDYPKFFNSFNAPPERKWQIEVQARLIEYAKMQEGWDSYGAPPIGWDTGMFALSILNDVMRNRTPIPQVVPSATGGVQLEWHERGIDLELHITGPYQCELWFQDHYRPNDPPVSQELTDDFSALLKPIELLTTR